MTFEQRKECAESVFEASRNMLYSKGKEYAGSHDSLDNFKRNAARLGLSKYQIWAVYFNKHIDSLNSAIARDPNKPTGITESLHDRIVDVVTYATILEAMIEEDKTDLALSQYP